MIIVLGCIRHAEIWHSVHVVLGTVQTGKLRRVLKLYRVMVVVSEYLQVFATSFTVQATLILR